MLLTVPIKPNDLGFNELIEALENCPSIQDPQMRKDVIGFFPDIGKQVEERNTVRASVLSILKAFSGYPDRFDELIGAIDYYEQNNGYFKTLIQVVRGLARQQQQDLTTDMGVRQFNAQIDNTAGAANAEATRNYYNELAQLQQNMQDSDMIGRNRILSALVPAVSHHGVQKLKNLNFITCECPFVSILKNYSRLT
jgi:hypothetical protein